MSTDTLQKDLLELEDEVTAQEETSSRPAQKTASAFKTISEVAELLDVPQHVLRFWESRFPQVKPMKLRGGRRYYRPEDIAVLTRIKHLLYREGYTIKGARKVFDQKVVELKTEAAKQPATPQPPQKQPAPAVAEAKEAKDAKKPSANTKAELQALLAELQELRTMLKSA